MRFSKQLFATLAIFSTLYPVSALACACGCGVFDVSTSAMLPTHEGGMAFLEYDFMNQNKNWAGTSRAPAANDDDKDIKSSFVTVGAQYMFDRAWGAAIEVPATQRHFSTTDDDTANIDRFNHAAVGDIRLKGIYSGFSPDMSSGITFGIKLPTGNYQYHGFDRDTEIGSGSTDVLLGAYHMGTLVGMWNWFANGQLDQPILTTAGYRPGSELDASTGIYYNGWVIGSVKVAPLAQFTNSYRLHDRGMAANPANSGYERVLFSPGVEVDMSGTKLDGSIGTPVYQQVRGNQLTAGQLFSFTLSRGF